MKKILFLMFAVALVFSGCNDIELCDDDHGNVTFVAQYDNSNGNIVVPETHNFYFGTEAEVVAPAPGYSKYTVNYAEQAYPLFSYNDAEMVVITDKTASVPVTDGYVESMPGWLWAHNGSYQLKKDEMRQVVDMPMSLLMRQLNVTVIFEGPVTTTITGVTTELSGVASTVNMATGALGAAAKVTSEYRKLTDTDIKYYSSARMLGTIGTAANNLAFVVETADGQKTFNCDISSIMSTFNDKSTAFYNVIIVVKNIDGIPSTEIEEEDPSTDPPVVPEVAGVQVQLIWEGIGDDITALRSLELTDDQGKVFTSSLKIIDVNGEQRWTTTQLTSTPASMSKLMFFIVYEGEYYTHEVTLSGAYKVLCNYGNGVIDMKNQTPTFTRAGGEERTNYTILSATHFNNIRNDLNGKYTQLATNINLSTYPNFVPIGFESEESTSDAPFTGIYIGGATKKISNLNINIPTGGTPRYAGVFCYTDGAIIDGMNIESGAVTSVHYSGSIVGLASQTTISNCSNKATVTGAAGAGGLVDYIDGFCLMTNCTNSGTVKACLRLGGIVGRIYGTTEGSSTLRNCHNTGDIDVISMPSVIDENDEGEYLGGLIGFVVMRASNNVTTIDGCSNDGKFLDTGWWVGGIVGSAQTDVTYTAVTNITNCVNNSSLITTDRLGNAGGMAGSFFNGKIKGCTNYGSFYTPHNGDYNFGGMCGFMGPQKGVEAGSIEDCVNYGNMSIPSNCNAGGMVGLTFDRITLKNCVNEGKITAHRALGGMIGHGVTANAERILITGCTNNGIIQGGAWGSGGMIGNAGKVDVVNCSNTGTVSGIEVGGIVGGATQVSIVGCKNSAKITANGEQSGGILGLSNGTTSVSSCYNTGDIAGKYYTGGIIGQNAGTVSGCYNTGVVTATTAAAAGGVCGRNIAPGTVSDCYWKTCDFPAAGTKESDCTTVTNCSEFASANWPTSGIYWPVAQWKSFGSYASSAYPQLSWE